MNRIKKITFCFLILFLVTFFVEAATIRNPLDDEDIGSLLERIGSEIGSYIAAIATIVLIVSGIYFLISAGNPENIEKSKNMIKYAIIGIIIGLSAQAIINTVRNVIGG